MKLSKREMQSLKQYVDRAIAARFGTVQHDVVQLTIEAVLEWMEIHKEAGNAG